MFNEMIIKFVLVVYALLVELVGVCFVCFLCVEGLP